MNSFKNTDRLKNVPLQSIMVNVIDILGTRQPFEYLEKRRKDELFMTIKGSSCENCKQVTYWKQNDASTDSIMFSLTCARGSKAVCPDEHKTIIKGSELTSVWFEEASDVSELAYSKLTETLKTVSLPNKDIPTTKNTEVW